MLNSIKKTAAAFILLTFVAINTRADCPPPCGQMQCPATPDECSLVDVTPANEKFDKNQKSDFITDIIVKLFEKVGFLF